MRIQVGIDYKAPPNRVKDAMVHATGNAFGVSSKPEPKVFLHHFGESSIAYEVKFWIEDHSKLNDILDSIQTNLWYELQRRRIRIPFPTRTVQLQRSSAIQAEETRSAPRVTLRAGLLVKVDLDRGARGKVCQIDADGAGDRVLLRDLLDLIARQLSALDELVVDGVVLGDLLDLAAAKQCSNYIVKTYPKHVETITARKLLEELRK
jgi:hypothetical protein